MSTAIAKKLEADIEALFADARDAVGSEIGPIGPDGNPYFTIANGWVKPEGYPARQSESPEQAAAETLKLIKEICPKAASQTLIWRRRPEFRTEGKRSRISLRLGVFDAELRELRVAHGLRVAA